MTTTMNTSTMSEYPANSVWVIAVRDDSATPPLWIGPFNPLGAKEIRRQAATMFQHAEEQGAYCPEVYIVNAPGLFSAIGKAYLARRREEFVTSEAFFGACVTDCYQGVSRFSPSRTE